MALRGRVEGRPLLLRQRLLVQLMVKLLMQLLRVYQRRMLLCMQAGLGSPLRLVARVLSIYAAMLCYLV